MLCLPSVLILRSSHAFFKGSTCPTESFLVILQEYGSIGHGLRNSSFWGLEDYNSCISSLSRVVLIPCGPNIIKILDFLFGSGPVAMYSQVKSNFSLSNTSKLSLGDLKNALSGDHLLAIYRWSNIHLRFLNRIKESFVRESRGFKVVYALDFQELYTYAYPFSPSQDDELYLHFVTCRYLLENSTRPFIIPFGAVQELVNHVEDYLRPTIGVAEKLREILSSRIELDDPVNQQGILDISRSLSSFRDFDPLLDTKSLALDITSTLAKTSFAMQRMSQFLGKRNVINLLEEDIGHNQITRELYDNFYSEIYDNLEIKRPGRHLSNTADAYNVYWTAQVRVSTGSKSPVYPYLITHTPTLIQAIPALSDRFSRVYGFESPLLWSPATAMYATILDNNPQIKAENVIDWINSARAICLKLQTVLDPIMLESDKTPDANFFQDINFILELDDAQLGKLNSALEPFYDYAVHPFAKPLSEFENILHADSSFDSDKRLNFEVGQNRDVLDDQIRLHMAIEQAKDRIQNLYGLIQKLMSPDQAASIKREPKSYEHGFSIEDLGYMRTTETTPATVVKKLTRRIDNTFAEIIRVDIREDFASIYWDVGSSLQRCLRSMNTKLLQLNKRGITVLDSKDDVFEEYKQGLIAYIAEGEQDVPDPRRISTPINKLPIVLPDIFKETKSSSFDFIRVNTCVGDFCFHSMFGVAFEEESHPRKVRKIGLITHLNLSNLVAEFFHETSHHQIGISRLSAYLDDCLRNLRNPLSD